MGYFYEGHARASAALWNYSHLCSGVTGFRTLVSYSAPFAVFLRENIDRRLEARSEELRRLSIAVELLSAFGTVSVVGF